MKTILTLVLIAVAIAGHGQPLSSERQIVFRNVSIVSPDDERVIGAQTVVIDDGRIIALGDAGNVSHDADALIIPADGQFLMPGLAEMHAHIPPTDDVQSMKEVLMLFAANGITTIRGMLGHEKHLELRDAVKRGEVIGPNFYTTGPSFNGMSVKSPDDGATMVRAQKKAGYDYLKLHPGLTRQKFDAIAATANEVGIPFAGHVSYGVGVWRAIDAGYSSIDHLDGFIEGLVPGIERIPEPESGLFGMYVADKADRSQIPKLMKALKDNNIWIVPTQALAERWFHPEFTVEDFERDPNRIYVSPETRSQWTSAKQNLISNPKYDPAQMKRFVELRRQLILECQKNGVGLLLGCDAPQIFNVPGFSTHQELEYLVVAGLTPWQAIKTGTVNVAKYLGRNDSGIVKKGAAADLILLNSNPVSRITNSMDISGVMIQGRWMDRKFLDAELKKLEK
jgi:imidazolonepropionase-like amidohydrolase